MGGIAVAAGAAILSALGIGFIFGLDRGRASHRRQVAAAHDVASRIACDMRTQPHTRDEIRRDLLPLLTERDR